MDDLRISALLCTRLCHDLIGPAGAVVNGVELLSESPANVDDEVLDLIRHSAAETTRRLTYFRMALGVPAEGQTLSSCRAVADDYFETSKIALDWSDGFMETPAPLPELFIPILLNLIICAAETLPRGGRIAIDGASEAGGFALRIKAEGEAIKFDDDTRLNLSGDRDPGTVEARGIAPYMAARLVSAAGGAIDAAPASTSMGFSVTLPNRPTA